MATKQPLHNTIPTSVPNTFCFKMLQGSYSNEQKTFPERVENYSYSAVVKVRQRREVISCRGFI